MFEGIEDRLKPLLQRMPGANRGANVYDVLSRWDLAFPVAAQSLVSVRLKTSAEIHGLRITDANGDFVSQGFVPSGSYELQLPRGKYTAYFRPNGGVENFEIGREYLPGSIANIEFPQPPISQEPKLIQFETLVVTTLAAEFEAFRKQLRDVQDNIVAGGLQFSRGSYGPAGQSQEVSILRIQEAPGNLSQTIEQAIFHGARIFISLGIAAGTGEQRVGDVVIGSEVWEQSSNLTGTARAPSKTLLEMAKKVIQTDEWQNRLQRPTAAKPRASLGTIASAERIDVVSRQIRLLDKRVTAVDSTAAQFFEVVARHPTAKGLAVRGISGLEDPSKPSDLETAASTASAFCLALLDLLKEPSAYEAPQIKSDSRDEPAVDKASVDEHSLDKPGLDKQKAVFYARFVNAAYGMFKRDPSQLTPEPAPGDIPEPYELVAWLNMSDFLFLNDPPKFCGFIVRHREERHDFILAFRGMESWVEWLDSAMASLVPFGPVPSAARVARGFDKLYATLKVVKRRIGVEDAPAARPSVEPSVTQQVMRGSFTEQSEHLADTLEEPEVQEQTRRAKERRPRRSFVVTGHGLGAALATLFVLENKAKNKFDITTICTFASPRVGNAEFVQLFNQLPLTSWRIVNTLDVIPRVPLRLPFLDYKHVETEFAFSSAGEVKGGPACWHSMSTYLHWLDPAIAVDSECKP